MNPELQKELAAWLLKLREGADTAGGFVLEQAPLVVQEKILLGRVSLTLGFLLSTAIAVALGVMIYRHVVRVFAENGDAAELFDTSPGIVMGGGIGCAFAAIFAISIGFEALTVWFAPRIYVIEWLAGLVK